MAPSAIFRRDRHFTSLEFPNWRVARPMKGIKRQARKVSVRDYIRPQASLLT
jgi:hypothetical protein